MAGNTFGKFFTVSIFGESHGIALGGVVDGCPPGLALCEEDLQVDLDRRKPGTSRYTTARREDDEVQILSGVFEGKTTGTSIGLLIKNKDQRSQDYSNIANRFARGMRIIPTSKNTVCETTAEVAAHRLARLRFGLPRGGLLKNSSSRCTVSKFTVSCRN